MPRLVFLLVTGVLALACAAQRPPTPREERAFLDTLRWRSAERLVGYRKMAEERESIYASIDRTRVARIQQLDSVLRGSP